MILELRFNICFCISGEHVLLLHRNRPPNRFLWNGVGGKVDPGESPYASVAREVAEETGMDLLEANAVRFGGVVRWPSRAAPSIQIGMYVYVARFDDARVIWDGDRHMAEGRLAWKPLAWTCDAGNAEVADNLPHILPWLLQEGEPLMYVCDYDAERLLLTVDIQPLDTRGFGTVDQASSSV